MIDLNETNKDLWRDVDPSGDLRYCFACGTCIVGCPASEADPPLLVRSLARMVALGMEDELLDEDAPWTCVTCSKCEEMCPMGVKPFELNLAIRRWQCREDETRIPPATTEVFKRGYTQAVDKAGELRARVGLTEPLATLPTLPDLQEKFQEMLMSVEVIEDADYMFRS